VDGHVAVCKQPDVQMDSASCGCNNCNISAATHANTLGSTRHSRRCMDSLRIEGCMPSMLSSWK
jgi:hypothetical protein